MSVIKKTLFDEKLENINVLINDTDANSKYFQITELPETFTGGKNAFLIQGSEYLVPDTVIKIQIKDANGDTIYYEPGEGIVSSSVNGEWFVSEYYEGTSKVVSVYVYPNRTIDSNGNFSDGTAYGPATITILGELKEYESNGLVLPIPDNWKDTYNVKWTKTVNVNPALPNTTKIRFYRRPTARITELLQPLYSIDAGTGLKVNSGVSQSFAQIDLSNLETFAGDVKRVKVYRTSEGDISDYDLIQDVLLESKELLTTYGLSGSVVGNTGTFTSETLSNYWNTGSLTAQLTSSRVESGLKLSGSGILTYTQSLDINSANTYELNLDAFYSGTVDSNLGIYLSSGSVSSSIGTLYGLTPTKNLSDTVIPFTIANNYPTASLYFSQSNGEWHIGNISLKLSQDTAFSPDSVSFITTMPTILGNDIFNFKFEFYDLNNNYVPVFVTQSATFVGAPTTVNTSTIISASLSQSLDALYRVSSSISGTMTVYSSSASGSISQSLSSSIGYTSGSVYTLSGSVSSSIYNLSSSVSQSNANILSSSLSKVQQLADGRYSGSFIGDTVIYSPAIGGQVGYIKELFTVGDTSAAQINLDARTTTRKIYIGAGTASNSNTSVYLDSAGQFSLKDKLTWDGSSLSVNGSITVTGGNAATDTNAQLYATRAATSASISGSNALTAAGNAATSASLSSSAATAYALSQSTYRYNQSTALLQSLADGGYSGSFIGSTTIYSPNIGGANGYISNILKVGQNGITLDGGNKAIYVGTGTYANTNTPFYFKSGSTNIFSLGDKLTFNGTALAVSGTINASTFNGGTITIGSKFAVDSSGNVTATNATLTGTVNADSGRFGSGSNYWTIGASTVENNVTSNGRLVLNAARPALEIYDGSGDLRVDLSAASTFSSTSPASITPSGDITSQTSRASGEIATGGSGASSYDSTQYLHNQSVTFSGASYVGKVATIRIPITGTAGSTSATATSLVSNNLSITYGVIITKTGGTVVATLTGTRSVSGGSSSTATLPTYNGLVLTTGLTLENTTYTVTPFVSNINMFAFTSGGTVSSFTSTVYTPDFDGSISVSIPVGKTEIVAGGLQIIRDNNNWVKIDRDASSTFDILQVKGNASVTGSAYVSGQIVCVGDITANLSDARLKENIIPIKNPLQKISEIDGVYYTFTDEAIELNSLLNKDEQVGLLAQQVQKVLPHIIKPAPFDIDHDQKGNYTSKSGENYLTIQYEKLVPLLVEAIKELKKEVDELKNR